MKYIRDTSPLLTPSLLNRRQPHLMPTAPIAVHADTAYAQDSFRRLTNGPTHHSPPFRSRSPFASRLTGGQNSKSTGGVTCRFRLRWDGGRDQATMSHRRSDTGRAVPTVSDGRTQHHSESSHSRVPHLYTPRSCLMHCTLYTFPMYVVSQLIVPRPLFRFVSPVPTRPPVF